MFIDVLDDDEPLTYEPGNNFLIYSDQEIASATLELEKKRRRFCNEKAEQLANNPQMPTANKTTISWIIYVAWTLRKTSFIEGDAKKASQEENVLSPKEASTRKVTSQKPGTMAKNMERMDAAHVALNLSKRWSNDNFAKPPD